jgi:hypothetical protein
MAISACGQFFIINRWEELTTGGTEITEEDKKAFIAEVAEKPCGGRREN